MRDFGKFEEELVNQERFYSSLTGSLWMNNLKKFEMKTMKDHHELHLECDVLL